MTHSMARRMHGTAREELATHRTESGQHEERQQKMREDDQRRQQSLLLLEEQRRQERESARQEEQAEQDQVAKLRLQQQRFNLTSRQTARRDDTQSTRKRKDQERFSHHSVSSQKMSKSYQQTIAREFSSDMRAAGAAAGYSLSEAGGGIEFSGTQVPLPAPGVIKKPAREVLPIQYMSSESASAKQSDMQKVQQLSERAEGTTWGQMQHGMQWEQQRDNEWQSDRKEFARAF